MKYTKGNRVRHPVMGEWGVGLVLADSQEDKARIFFEEVGEKTVSLKHVRPVILSGAASESVVLDNLKIEKGSVGVRYKSLNASIDHFLKEFPGGFQGERFDFHERDHKVEIRDTFQELLGRKAFNELLETRDYKEVCARALRLTGVRANAMIFKSEKISLRDGLKEQSAQERFAKSLHAVLHEEDNFDSSFDALADSLNDIGARKWTIATYFLFFTHPDRHMFVKPTITQNAAEVCAFDIGYRPEVNARTYRMILAFSRFLSEGIARLGPRDMIDVQSFMWCIAPGTYSTEDI